MLNIRNAVRVLFGGSVGPHVPLAYPSGALSTAGQRVGESNVMQLSAVSACVRLIAQSISTLPLNVYDTTGPNPRVLRDHWLNSILSVEPSPGVTPSMFWESAISSALLHGQGCAEELYYSGRLVGIQFLPVSRLTRVTDRSGAKIWRYTDDSGDARDIPLDRLFQLTGFTLDGATGVSAIRYGANIFGSALAANEAAANTFSNGLLPTMAFQFPHVVPEDQRETFKKYVREVSGSMRAGDPVALEAGMTATQIGISPDDAQLLESRQFSIEEICRWFGVPPHMIGHTSNSTSWGTGLEQQTLGFLTYTLRPWLKRIEETVTVQLLPPAERGRRKIAFDIDELLRTDSAARANYQSQMVNNGLRTRDELRVKDGLPPMGGNAATLTIQSAMMPIDKLGTRNDAV